MINFGDYSGTISAMRTFLIMIRFYDYLLKNDITENVWDATKDVHLNYDLYGVAMPDIEVKTKKLDFDCTEQTKEATFTAKKAWTATASENWITVEPASGEAGDITLKITVAANQGDAREGKVIVKGGNVTDGIEIAINQVKYTAPSEATIKDFAQEYVKIINVWASHVGNINRLSNWEIAKDTDEDVVENVHYVPNDYTIVVGGKTYNTADMLETALRSYLLLRGWDGNETEKNGFGNIPKYNPVTMSAEVPETHNYYFGNYPYAEPSNGGYLCKVDGDKEIYRQVEVRILDNWAQRSVNFQHGQAITNMCTYPRADHNITDYKGCFSAMRALITYAHFFKYMLDNNLERADGIADSQIIRSELFGVEHKETEPLAVDLGLSVKWATFNVGATNPEEHGDYFAWGETKPKTTYNWSTYKFELGTGYDGPFSKYVTYSSYGTVDNKTVLDPEDDAAHVNWGGSWRMPTDAEWTELRTICTWTWTTQNGVNGRKVTGPNGNSIFLPAAGYRYDTSFYDAGSYGFYWSSSLSTDDPGYAWGVHFISDGVGRYGYDLRCNGRSVRPVTE